MRPWPRSQRRLGTTGFRERARTTRLSAETSARGRSRGGSQRDEEALWPAATGSIEIEGGERSPGAKAVADRVDVGERRRRLELPNSLDRPPESEIGSRPDVRSAQGEHQDTVSGKSPDTLDLHELRAGCVVIEIPQPLEIEPTIR